MFDSLVYGTKFLTRLIRNNWKPSQGDKDGYLEYVRSRPRHDEVKAMLLLAVAFAVLSAAAAFLA